MGIVEDIFERHAAVLQETRKRLAGRIAEAAALIAACYRRRGKVVLFGNGGSAADALHIEAELLCRFRRDREGLPAIAAGSGLPSLTAASNDYSFAEGLAHLVRGLVAPGDVAIAISTSGDSPNIVNAARAASERGGRIVALTGETGGRLKEAAHILINVPSRDTPRIQEAHATIGHILCEMVEGELFGGNLGPPVDNRGAA